MANGMNGWVNLNQLYSQMNPTGTLPQALNSMLVNGYGNFGNQLQGAMGQIGSILDANAWRNVANNSINAQYEASRVPIEVEQMRQSGQANRLSQISPLLTQLFGSLGGGTGGGLAGFQAVGADGTPFAKASMGGSEASHTPTNRYRRSTSFLPER